VLACPPPNSAGDSPKSEVPVPGVSQCQRREAKCVFRPPLTHHHKTTQRRRSYTHKQAHTQSQNPMLSSGGAAAAALRGGGRRRVVLPGLLLPVRVCVTRSRALTLAACVQVGGRGRQPWTDTPHTPTHQKQRQPRQPPPRPARRHQSTTTTTTSSSQLAGPLKRMNLFTAVNDALRIALETDPSAVSVCMYVCVCVCDGRVGGWLCM
jgi:hypothetical protein